MSEFVFEILNSLSSPIVLVDEDLCCVYINSAFKETFKFSKDEEGLTLSELWQGFSRDSLSDLSKHHDVSIALGSGISEVAKAGISRCGDSYLIQFMPTDDSSERIHKQRLETLGVLASGVAHDFNNVLAGVLGHVSYLQNILPGKGEHIESLRAIEDGSKKASLLTKQILDFSKFESEEKAGVVNVSLLASQISRLLKGSMPSHCKISLFLPEEDACILGIEGKLAQILVNLIVNARDACLDDDGVVTLLVEPTSDLTLLKKLFNTEELSSESYVELRVVDNGTGISLDILDKVFDPYFSTKGSNGTGLGLSTVKDIVHELGGAIDIQSELGTGTALSVFLPQVKQEVELVRGDEDVKVRHEQGSERILIVDDESSVRNVISLSLEHLGYDVTTASSGMEALDKAQNSEKPFDLVILDMLMPDLSGEETYEKLLEIDPELPALVISGYSSKEAVQKVLDSGGRGYIQKPFTIDDLASKVRHCLGEDD